jgi:hypothetical protein
MHLAQSKNGNFSASLSFVDAAVDRGAAPLRTPRLRCTRAGWSHAATQHWTECLNVAPCLGLSPSTSPPPPPPNPPNSPKLADGTPSPRRRPVPSLVGWMPAGVRDSCKAWHATQSGQSRRVG